MIRVYGKVEGGIFEPYAATTDDPTLVGQEVTMDWIDYDEYNEDPMNHCQQKLALTFKKEETSC